MLGLELSINRSPAGSRATHVFLLAGQSNMVGRADHDGGPDYPDRTLQWDRAGNLVAASSPLDHVDAQPGDMGLPVQFAIDYHAQNPGVQLVFVPSAAGGTGFHDSRWNKGDDLYEEAVARSNAAMEALPGAVFAGILWHQGETDAGTEADANAYAAALDTMIAHMRADIVAARASTPFVAGQLYIAGGPADTVRAALADLPNRVAATSLAGSNALTSFDALHFDAPSLRALGSRYVTALAVAKTGSEAVPLAVQAFDTASDGTARTTYTFSGITVSGFGAKIVGVVNRDPGVTGVTVGGVAGTQVGLVNANSNELSFWLVNNVTGSSADVVVTFGAAPSRCFVHVWSLPVAVEGTDVALTSAQNNYDGHVSITASADVSAGGLLLAVANGILGTPDWTWTGATERAPESEAVGGADYWSGAADHAASTAETARIVTVNFGDEHLASTLALLSVAPRS